MQKLFGSFKDIVIIFLCALALSLFIKGFLIDNRVIPTSSMVPTVPVNSRVLVNRLVYDFTEPKFQDIVIFEPTDGTKVELGRGDDLLKRVIGTPGDIVEVKDGQLYINEVAIDEPYLAEPMDYEFGPVEVPEGCYLMLGDNRNASFDSHLWSDPFVPVENIKGKAFLLYWPLENFKLLS
jgi:signal peptidase I